MPEAKRQKKIGLVVSSKMTGTVVVAIESSHRHPIYQKAIKRTARIMADNPDNTWQAGDSVIIESTKPLSKHKSWRIVAGEHTADTAPAMAELEVTE